MERISREDLYTGIAKLVSKRSTCPRKKVGCVLVKDKRVIAMGYNGVLPGVKPEEGINPDGSSNTVHAEANLIAFCAREGISTKGCDLYITLSPCLKCVELIIQAGIVSVHFIELYRDPMDAINALEKQGIKVYGKAV